jgi:hypothetical protein
VSSALSFDALLNTCEGTRSREILSFGFALKKWKSEAMHYKNEELEEILQFLELLEVCEGGSRLRVCRDEGAS